MYRAVSKRIIRYNPFEGATYEKVERKIRFLQKSDVAKLMALKVNDKEAEQARQMFLFSCFTGLAIADMERLKFSHIQTAADGKTTRSPEGRRGGKVTRNDTRNPEGRTRAHLKYPPALRS